MTNIPNDKRALDYGSAFAIFDEDTSNFKTVDIMSCLNDARVIDEYLDTYRQWIQTTNNNSINGFDQFKYACYSNGTTEAFDKFYMKNRNRRFRCFKGEYMYHKLAWRDKFDWLWIEEDSLRPNDAVVISLPFADTGAKHNEYDWLMTQCSLKNIPVLVDCAYFGICNDINFDFTAPCITDITFSLSKTFPVANARIGIRFTKEDNDDTMFVYHKIHYNNKIGAAIGLNYLEDFSPDYIYNKYNSKQKQLCKELNVKPSKTVLFGIDFQNLYPEYNRGSTTNRLSFHKQLIKE